MVVRLGRAAHDGCTSLTIWAVALGATLSAAFIMAANSWMQHPVGYEINADTGRPELTSISALFTNPVFVWGYTHVILASLVTGSLVMLSVSAWQIRRGKSPEVFVRSMKLVARRAAPGLDPRSSCVGSHLGVIETKYQPMKVAAMEAQWDTCSAVLVLGGADRRLERVRPGRRTRSSRSRTCSRSWPPGTWDGKVVGINELQSQYEKKYGPGDYIPNLFIQYWSMRVMAYLGSVLPILALWGCFLWWRRRLLTARFFLWVGTWAFLAPFAMNTAGWLLTENGRQPWVVQGLLLHQGRQLALGQPHRGRPEPGHLRRPVPRARHRVGLPDAALRQASARAGP